MWGHPHDGTPSSSQLSRSVHLCLLASNTALFRAPTSESHYAGHACQICQLTNGRAGWPAEIRIKEGSPDHEHSFNALVKYRAHQESSTRRKRLRLTARPRCLVDRALHHSAEHHAWLSSHDASWTWHYTPRLSTLPSGTQPSTSSTAATAIHHGPTTSQLRIQCTSSPAADRTPLCHTVTLFSDCSQHRWGRPSNITTKLGNWATTTVWHLRH